MIIREYEWVRKSKRQARLVFGMLKLAGAEDGLLGAAKELTAALGLIYNVIGCPKSVAMKYFESALDFKEVRANNGMDKMD